MKGPVTMMTYLKMMRIRQWVKNGFVFMPVVFAGALGDGSSLARACAAFLLFSLATSGTYIINDLLDRAADQHHPRKRHRPIASGAVSVAAARLSSAVLIAVPLAVSPALSGRFSAFLAAYIVLSVAYSFFLKGAVLLDVIGLAAGFELRIWAGSVAIGVVPSTWLELCVFVLALFLGFIKRRHEKVSLHDAAVEHRGVLTHYTSYFLDQMIMISATLCIVFYGLYVMSADLAQRLGHSAMAYTIPFVVYGIFRYLYIVHVKKAGDDPTDVMISDIPFLANIILWICLVIFSIYLQRPS